MTPVFMGRVDGVVRYGNTTEEENSSIFLPNVNALVVIGDDLRNFDATKVTIRPSFPGHVLFLGLCPGVWAGFRKSAVFPGFFGSICKYIQMLRIAKAYDGTRQRKLVRLQYKMWLTSQKRQYLYKLRVHVYKSKWCAHH